MMVLRSIFQWLQGNIPCSSQCPVSNMDIAVEAKDGSNMLQIQDDMTIRDVKMLIEKEFGIPSSSQCWEARIVEKSFLNLFDLTCTSFSVLPPEGERHRGERDTELA